MVQKLRIIELRVLSFIPIFLTLTLLVVFVSNRLDTGSANYIKATRSILKYEDSKSKKSINIYSRANTISLMDSRIMACNLDKICSKPDYFILSNSSHVSLVNVSDGELDSINQQAQEHRGCSLVDIWKSEFGVTMLYRCPKI